MLSGTILGRKLITSKHDQKFILYYISYKENGTEGLATISRLMPFTVDYSVGTIVYFTKISYDKISEIQSREEMYKQLMEGGDLE